jgi:hypothetical protein
MFVLYRSSDGHVQQLTYHRSKPNLWEHQILTTGAGAVPAAGSVTGLFLDHADKLNVIYQGTDGLLHELWQDGREWKHAFIRVKNAAAAPPAPEHIASLSCYVNGRPKAYIVYATKDGQLIVLSREQERAS